MFIPYGQERTEIVTQGLIYYMDFNDKTSYPGTGAVLTNISKAPTTVSSLINSPVYSAAQGGSIGLNGTTMYINTNYIFNTTSSFTYNLVFKTATTAGSYLLWKPSDHVPAPNFRNLFRFYLNLTAGDGKLHTILASSSWALTINYTSSKKVNDNTWHMASGIYSKEDGIYYLYIDGVLDSSVTAPNTILTSSNAASQAVKLGSATPDYTTNYTSCSIASLQVYNRALTAQEVKQNFEYYRIRYGI